MFGRDAVINVKFCMRSQRKVTEMRLLDSHVDLSLCPHVTS
jgi:hypothetical protein